jgi:hypothetical protein
MTASTLRIASATARGGSSPWRDLGGMVIIIASQFISRAVSYNDLAILSRNVSVTMSTVSVCLKPRYVCKMVHELLYPLMVTTSFGVLEVLHPYITILIYCKNEAQQTLTVREHPTFDFIYKNIKLGAL